MKSSLKIVFTSIIIFFQSCYLNPFLYKSIFTEGNNDNLFLYSLFGYRSGSSTNSISGTTSSNYILGGTISGLTATGLILSSGATTSETLSISSGTTSFQFASKINSGLTYNVSVSTQPIGLVCSVTNNAGTISATVTNVAISCTARTLNSYKFSYTGANPTWTSAVCSSNDESTGIGQYNFTVDAANDDMLFTATSNLAITGVCDGSNQGEISFYIDGVKQQTSSYNRCWGQTIAMNTAFIIPSMSLGNHTMELKFCSTNARPMVIDSTT